MKHLLRKCLVCNIYTLKNQCPSCSVPTVDPNPAKFSPDDKYILYRISDSHKNEK